MEKLFGILFENDELLVVNKRAGLVCHPTKNGEMSSLIGRVRLYLLGRVSSPAADASAISPHLINRLDRETSVVVIIAKNPEIAGELGKILESRAVEKEYLAIVRGHVVVDQGIIDVPLGKDEQSQVAIKDCIRPDGVPAQTGFFVERRFERVEGKFSLLRVSPQTGRKHQIRIHLAHLGHPIVGDKLYGGDEDNYLAFVQNRLTGAQRAKLILGNQALHARAIKFVWRGNSLQFSCAPEPWFNQFIATGSQSAQRK